LVWKGEFAEISLNDQTFSQLFADQIHEWPLFTGFRTNATKPIEEEKI